MQVNKIFVMPIAGARIRQLANNHVPVPDDGCEVEECGYYHRHIARGDLRIGTAEERAAKGASMAAAEKAAQEAQDAANAAALSAQEAQDAAGEEVGTRSGKRK